MLRPIDPTDPTTARRIVEIQLAAYAVEAELIGFGGIPQLSESTREVVQLASLTWVGAFEGDALIGLIALDETERGTDIDRLAVDPAFARQGFGRRLVQSILNQPTITVSTGARNLPAIALYEGEGFKEVGTTEIAPGVITIQFRRD